MPRYIKYDGSLCVIERETDTCLLIRFQEKYMYGLQTAVLKKDPYIEYIKEEPK